MIVRLKGLTSWGSRDSTVGKEVMDQGESRHLELLSGRDVII